MPRKKVVFKSNSPMYNLLEYSGKNDLVTIEDENHDVDNYNDASESKSFKYKTKIIGKLVVRSPRPPITSEEGDQPLRTLVLPLNTEVTSPLKYLSNFWRSLDLLLINWEVELDLW